MRSRKLPHLGQRRLVEFQLEVERFCYGCVGDIVMSVKRNGSATPPTRCRKDLRRANPTACHHKIIVLGHALGGFYDFVFVIGNDFDSLHVHSQGETEAGKECRIGVDRLCHTKSAIVRPSRHLFWHHPLQCEDQCAPAFPPSTSSPIIIHPAVCIGLF